MRGAARGSGASSASFPTGLTGSDAGTGPAQRALAGIFHGLYFVAGYKDSRARGAAAGAAAALGAVLLRIHFLLLATYDSCFVADRPAAPDGAALDAGCAGRDAAYRVLALGRPLGLRSPVGPLVWLAAASGLAVVGLILAAAADLYPPLHVDRIRRLLRAAVSALRPAVTVPLFLLFFSAISCHPDRPAGFPCFGSPGAANTALWLLHLTALGYASGDPRRYPSWGASPHCGTPEAALPLAAALLVAAGQFLPSSPAARGALQLATSLALVAFPAVYYDPYPSAAVAYAHAAWAWALPGVYAASIGLRALHGETLGAASAGAAVGAVVGAGAAGALLGVALCFVRRARVWRRYNAAVARLGDDTRAFARPVDAVIAARLAAAEAGRAGRARASRVAPGERDRDDPSVRGRDASAGATAGGAQRGPGGAGGVAEDALRNLHLRAVREFPRDPRVLAAAAGYALSAENVPLCTQYTHRLRALAGGGALEWAWTAYALDRCMKEEAAARGEETVDLHAMLAAARLQERRARVRMRAFWNMLLKDDIDQSRLPNAVALVEQSKSAAGKLYERLLDQFPNSSREFELDLEGAARLQARAQNIEESQAAGMAARAGDNERRQKRARALAASSGGAPGARSVDPSSGDELEEEAGHASPAPRGRSFRRGRPVSRSSSRPKFEAASRAPVPDPQPQPEPVPAAAPAPNPAPESPPQAPVTPPAPPPPAPASAAPSVSAPNLSPGLQPKSRLEGLASVALPPWPTPGLAEAALPQPPLPTSPPLRSPPNGQLSPILTTSLPDALMLRSTTPSPNPLVHVPAARGTREEGGEADGLRTAMPEIGRTSVRLALQLQELRSLVGAPTAGADGASPRRGVGNSSFKSERSAGSDHSGRRMQLLPSPKPQVNVASNSEGATGSVSMSRSGGGFSASLRSLSGMGVGGLLSPKGLPPASSAPAPAAAVVAASQEPAAPWPAQPPRGRRPSIERANRRTSVILAAALGIPRASPAAAPDRESGANTLVFNPNPKPMPALSLAASAGVHKAPSRSLPVSPGREAPASPDAADRAKADGATPNVYEISVAPVDERDESEVERIMAMRYYRSAREKLPSDFAQTRAWFGAGEAVATFDEHAVPPNQTTTLLAMDAINAFFRRSAQTANKAAVSFAPSQVRSDAPPVRPLRAPEFMNDSAFRFVLDNVAALQRAGTGLQDAMVEDTRSILLFESRVIAVVFICLFGAFVLAVVVSFASSVVAILKERRAVVALFHEMCPKSAPSAVNFDLSPLLSPRSTIKEIRNAINVVGRAGDANREREREPRGGEREAAIESEKEREGAGGDRDELKPAAAAVAAAANGAAYPIADSPAPPGKRKLAAASPRNSMATNVTGAGPASDVGPATTVPGTALSAGSIAEEASVDAMEAEFNRSLLTHRALSLRRLVLRSSVALLVTLAFPVTIVVIALSLFSMNSSGLLQTSAALHLKTGHVGVCFWSQEYAASAIAPWAAPVSAAELRQEALRSALLVESSLTDLQDELTLKPPDAFAGGCSGWPAALRGDSAAEADAAEADPSAGVQPSPPSCAPIRDQARAPQSGRNPNAPGVFSWGYGPLRFLQARHPFGFHAPARPSLTRRPQSVALHDSGPSELLDWLIDKLIVQAKSKVASVLRNMDIVFGAGVAFIVFNGLLAIPLAVRGIAREHEKTLSMLLMIPPAVVEKIPALREYMATGEGRTVQSMLEDNRAKTKSILEAASDAIIVCDSRGSIQVFNAAAEGLLGWSADEALAMPVSSIIPDALPHDQSPDDHDGFDEEERLAGFVGHQLSVHARRKDGSTFPTHVSVGCGRSGRRPFFVLFIRDVTERHLAEEALQAEKSRGERLLRNILPDPIIERLKQGGEDIIADAIDEATILFSDLVGFTSLASELSPADTVGMLSELFNRFDELVDAYGVDKVKTIGDAYMCYTRLPPEVMIDFALDMIETLHAINRELGALIAKPISFWPFPVGVSIFLTRRRMKQAPP
eukprot:tig00000131_g7476.t1